MRTVCSTELTATTKLDAFDRLNIYCGFDTLITSEVFENIRQQLDEYSSLVYVFERAMQSVAICMGRRGIRIDQDEHPKLLAELYKRHFALTGMRKDEKGKWVIVDKAAPLQQFALALWDKPINYNSPVQLKELFYGSLELPYVYDKKGGKKVVTTNRDALEKFADRDLRARPIANAIMRARDIEGQIEVLERGIDQDGRMRFSFKVAGTETGRWASAKNVFGGGGNIQNITMRLRRLFIPDPGYVFLYADLKTAESIAVAYLSEDENYIKACESGDLHSQVAYDIWGVSKDKAKTEKWYRDFTYRDMSKRGGHLSNYLGSHFMMARALKITQKMALEFQDKYFTKYSKIPLWHQKEITELQSKGILTTPFGRKRTFWGRLSDEATKREAIAHKPQSMVGDYMNIGLWRVWNYLEPEGLQVLLQCHDAILTQVPKDKVDYFASRMVEYLRVKVLVNDRIMQIPAELKTGYNWAEADPSKRLFDDGNERGLRDYSHTK